MVLDGWVNEVMDRLIDGWVGGGLMGGWMGETEWMGGGGGGGGGVDDRQTARQRHS